jgi:farnesyl-diphosphate farnesyltransferase
VRLSPLVLDPLRAAWLSTCEEHLAHGLHYVQSISDAKLRYATALPLLIGARTAALLRHARWEKLAGGIKLSRLEIAKLLADTAIACRDSTKIKRLYEKLSGKPAV